MAKSKTTTKKTGVKKESAVHVICRMLLEGKHTDAQITAVLNQKFPGAKSNSYAPKVYRSRLNSGALTDKGYKKPAKPIEEIVSAKSAAKKSPAKKSAKKKSAKKKKS